MFKTVPTAFHREFEVFFDNGYENSKLIVSFATATGIQPCIIYINMTETTTDKEKVESYRYLQVTPRDKSWGLAVTTVGFQHVHPGDSYPLSVHPDSYKFRENGHRVLNEYQIYYITRGSGYFESSSCSRTRIEAGMMFILFPGEWHTFSPDPDTGWDDHWIGFTGNFMDDKIRGGFFTFKNCVFRIGVDERIIGTFHEILEIAMEEKKEYQQVIASLAISLIGRIHYEDINHTYGDTYIERIINQAKAVMKEDTTNNEPLENIAHSLGVSYSFFRREFKKRCGVSPGQYRLELRLIKAKELLLSTNLSIADISAKLHFECIGQFSTFFKKKSGTSPLEFRKQGIKKD